MQGLERAGVVDYLSTHEFGYCSSPACRPSCMFWCYLATASCSQESVLHILLYFTLIMAPTQNMIHDASKKVSSQKHKQKFLAIRKKKVEMLKKQEKRRSVCRLCEEHGVGNSMWSSQDLYTTSNTCWAAWNTWPSFCLTNVYRPYSNTDSILQVPPTDLQFGCWHKFHYVRKA